MNIITSIRIIIEAVDDEHSSRLDKLKRFIPAHVGGVAAASALAGTYAGGAAGLSVGGMTGYKKGLTHWGTGLGDSIHKGAQNVGRFVTGKDPVNDKQHYLIRKLGDKIAQAHKEQYGAKIVKGINKTVDHLKVGE